MIFYGHTLKLLNRQRRLEHKLTRGVSDDMVKEMLKSFGYEPNTSLDTAPLWEFTLGQYNSTNSARTDGTTKSVLTVKIDRIKFGEESLTTYLIYINQKVQVED